MLVQVLKTAADVDPSYEDDYQEALQRLRLFAGHQERMISPDGTYPPIGRSITYRIGAFQSLAEAALTKNLPRSEEHTSELQSRFDLVCRLLLEKKNTAQFYR